MNDDELNKWLDSQWEQTLFSFESEADEEIDRFIRSTIVSIRYAFFTQLLGKFADADRDLLCLQLGPRDSHASVDGRWDPRSFCTRVVVPWVRRNQNVLGTSSDPYVNNPLRRPRLDEGMDSLNNREEWNALVRLLVDLQADASPSAVEETMVRCLKAIARRLREQSVEYPVPLRIGLVQLCGLLDRYLEVSDGGLRPLIVTTALMRILGEAFSIFTRVDSQGVNEADAASGAPGDVLCFGPDEELVLAVEVKGQNLTYVELESTIMKARSTGVENILFATPKFASADRQAIEAKIANEFALGCNVHQTSIIDLVRTAFSLLGEDWRVNFIISICVELDARTTQPVDRIAFAELLTD